MYIEIPITVCRDYDPDDDKDTITYAVKVFDRPVLYKKFETEGYLYFDAENAENEVKDEFAKRLKELLA